MDQNEEKLLRSVALQNAQAVLLARERAERELISAKEALEIKSAELAEQREFFRVTLSSIGDAVITTDTEARVTFLNPIAQTMVGWTAEEAIGQPLEKVFNIINEETRQPAPNPVAKVLREGKAAGLANHTALIARHGTEIPIDDSAAPIRDAEGKLSGVVMVFHDVTERRRVENALRRSNQELSEARDELEKRVQERTSELYTANENLRGLSASLLQMRDEEQRRLARELHDSVGQLIAAISMNISVVQGEADKLSPAVAKCVTDNAGLLEEVSREIRTISHLLHPPLLDEAGLASALRWYIEGFADRSKIRVELNIPDDFGRLPSDTEIAIFRIIQECLTNIHRHSESDTAAISIQQEASRLLVQVQDNGKGIPKEKQRELTRPGRTGVGFSGMRERLRQLGGTLEIQSEGRGTLISAVLKTD
ncbi:MAG TPA: PAS domain S-box protein [Candidatus Sulfotelmatobacter sp.]